MRFYPDRTLRIDLKDLTDEWVSLGYSEYCIRRVQGELEIKHSDDIFDLSDDEDGEVPCNCVGLVHRNDCPDWVLPF